MILTECFGAGQWCQGTKPRLCGEDFVERAFQEKREWFGAKRKTGARGLPVKDGDLFSLRDLKVQAVE